MNFRRVTNVLFSVLVSLFVLIGTLPISVLAEDPPNVCEWNGTGYAEFSEALNAAKAAGGDQTIKLLDSITYNSPMSIEAMHLTLDLYGYDLVLNPGDAGPFALSVSGGGSINLADSPGSFNVTGWDEGVVVSGAGSSATVTNASGKTYGAHAEFGGEITVLQNATGTGTTPTPGTGARAAAGGAVVVKGNVSGQFGAYATNTDSSIEVFGNAIASGSGFSTYGVAADGSNAKVIVRGNVTAEQCVGAYSTNEGSVEINGTMNASSYVSIGGTQKNPEDYTGESEGFRLYTDGINSGIVRVKIPTEPPSAPQNFKAFSGDSKAVLTWAPPVNTGGTITGYQVSSDNGSTWVPAASHSSHIFSSLTNGTTYSFKVRAINSAGEGTAAITTATPGSIGWSYRSPLPSSNSLDDVIYVNGKYMAVGYNGTLLTSTDGVNWQRVQVGYETDRLTGIAYGNGKYVIVCTASDYVAHIYTSSDGLSWTETAAIGSHWLYGVAFGDGKFVAVGQSGKILVSPDGVVWQTINIDSMKYTLLSVAHANGKFVAVGMGSDTSKPKGGIMVSTDGEHWTETHSHPTYTLWDVAHGQDTFVVVGGASSGNYYICTSTDGVSWTQRSAGVDYAQLQSVDYDGTKFVAVGRTSGTATISAFAITSTNGITWSGGGNKAKSNFRAVVCNDSQYVAVSGTGDIYTSNNSGTSWTKRTIGTTTRLRDVAWSGNLFVAVGREGNIQTSIDGVNWSAQTSGTDEHLNKVEYLDGQFIIVGTNGTILTSSDGSTWVSRSLNTTVELQGIAYGQGHYVVGGDGIVRISTDGIDWTAPTGLIALRAVAYGNGRFVALQKYGQAYSSTDGVTWAECGSLYHYGSKYPTDLIFASDTFVAVGGSGEVYTSANGTNWTTTQTDQVGYFQSIAYGGDCFIAVGESGNIYASYDKLNWFVQPSGLTTNPYFSLDDDANMYGVIAGNENFVVVGHHGVTLQSDSFSISTDTDAHDISIAKRKLRAWNILGSGSNANEGSIVANMHLFTTGEEGTTLSWTSSKPEYIATDGRVTRPHFRIGDQAVRLTATITKGVLFETKSFVVVVRADPAPSLTGASISGTPKYNETLTAAPTYSSIPDPLPTLTYQWNRNGTSIVGATNSTYTLVQEDIGNNISVTISATGSITGSRNSSSITIQKAEATSTPEAPTLSSKTYNSVTLAANVAYEFRVNNGSWQASNTFTGLTHSTLYTFYARYKATDTHNASETSLGLEVTTDAAPSMGGTTSITGILKFGETLAINTDGLTYTGGSGEGNVISYQWKRTGNTITSATNDTYTLVLEDINANISVTVSADGTNATGSVTSAAVGPIQKADGPGAPAAPTLASKTHNSITLVANAAHEYSINNGNSWQDSNVFTGLSASTSYSIVARIRATATHNSSTASAALNVSTNSAPIYYPDPEPYVPPAPPKTIISDHIETSDDERLEQTLRNSQNAQLDIPANQATISAGVLDALSEADKPLKLAGNEIGLSFPPAWIDLSEHNSAVVEITAEQLSDDEQAARLAEAALRNTTGLFEVCGKVFDLSVILRDGESVTTLSEFEQPVAITIDLSDLDLSEEEIALLTGVRLEPDGSGNLVPVSLGGTYDPVSKTFTFYTDRFSFYAVMQVQKPQLTIKLTLGSKSIAIDGEVQLTDVAPQAINGRTLVPLRFIAETLGAEVDWIQERMTAVIALSGTRIELPIGYVNPKLGLDVPAQLQNGRTLVPLRYISETLGATVEWHEITNTVEIVKY